MTSELGNQRWSVISERGLEASALSHEDARRLVHKLEGEGRHGLCIITDEAGNRMARARMSQSRRFDSVGNEQERA